MSSLMRNRPHGGSFFFTVRLADSQSDLLLREVDRLRIATRRTMARYPFRIDAIAVLPSVIHTVWTVPAGDTDLSHRWSMLKTLFSQGLPTPPHRSRAQIRRGDKGIWQRRFWQHPIRDAVELEMHVALVHTSPVQAGLCADPREWRHSSIHRRRAEEQPALPLLARPVPARAAAGSSLR